MTCTCCKQSGSAIEAVSGGIQSDHVSKTEGLARLYAAWRLLADSDMISSRSREMANQPSQTPVLFVTQPQAMLKSLSPSAFAILSNLESARGIGHSHGFACQFRFSFKATQPWEIA